MSSLLEKRSRWMPLFVGVMALSALIQVMSSLGVSVRSAGILGWIGAHAWTIAAVLGGAAGVCWILVYLSYLRACKRLLHAITKWSRLMDILDRLTNREEIERRLQAKAGPVIVDAQALAGALKSKV